MAMLSVSFFRFGLFLFRRGRGGADASYNIIFVIHYGEIFLFPLETLDRRSHNFPDAKGQNIHHAMSDCTACGWLIPEFICVHVMPDPISFSDFSRCP